MHKSIIFIILPLVLFTISCSPVHYAPNTQNITAFEEKGEVQISGGLNFTSNSLELNTGVSTELQMAYAPTSNLGLQFNNSFYSNDNLQKSNNNFHELGLGYYKLLDNNLVFEIYGLAGLGSSETKFNSVTRESSYGEMKSKYLRLGLQPSIAWRKDKVGMAFSTRFAHLNYYGIEGDLSYRNVDEVDYLRKRPKSFLVEPAIKLWAGGKNVKFFWQLQTSNNLTFRDFHQEDFSTTFGITTTFGGKN